MSQRVKRPNRSEDGSVPVKRRKRTAAEEEEAASLAASAWQPRSNDLKSIYNRTTTEAPAELFRKDLISAMKLPDSEPLATDEYWVIVDQWKQEWERGVQVPVNPDSLPEPNVTISHCDRNRVQHEFRLPKNKYIRITKDENFKPEEHALSNAPTQAEAACSYDLDECDVSWLRILNTERAAAGLCPVYEDQLERVIERFELCCWDKIQSILRNEEGLGIEYDENVICDVCRSPDSEEGNEMVFCDSCNICVHQACYGITRIPEGQWLCCTCNIGERPECKLCPNKGGAMKSTRSGQKWAHVSCALWIPEVSIGCVEKMEPITKISSIPSSRWALICVLCRERVGACIQCSVKTCKTAYHVTCAFKHGLEMRAIIEDENADDGVKLRSYCEKHSKSSKKSEKSVCSGSEDDDCKRKKRKDMTSEEKNQARAARLQEIEAEFFKHVTVKDVSVHLDLDNDALHYIYSYWKLKRKAGHNRPLLPPKSEDVDMLSHKREQADLEKMKMFVQLRQDLERVRNLCYMVSRREKLSRTFFRMREQTFHKQAAVLDAPHSLPTTVVQAVIEANHGPSIYDRLYSHNEAEDRTSDFDVILARIAGCKSPVRCVGDDATPEVNGLFKDVKNNPYKKLYYNGSKRRSGSLYGSSLSGASSSSSSDERPKDDKENRANSTSEEEVVLKPSISTNASKKSPRKQTNAVDKRRQKRRGKTAAASEEDVEPPEKERGQSSRSRLSQIDQELGESCSDSDELMPIRGATPNADNRKNVKSMSSIYSDSDSSSAKNDEDRFNDPQNKPRTKAAVKEFSQKPTTAKSPNKSSPENKKRLKKDGAKRETSSEKKDRVPPSDLIVPQRQAAKKATENLKSNTARGKEQQQQPHVVTPPAPVDEPAKIQEEKPKQKSKFRPSREEERPLPKEKKREKESVTRETCDVDKEAQEVLAYVPQRQAAKKAAEHIKSGLGKAAPAAQEPSPEPEKAKGKDKEPERDRGKKTTEPAPPPPAKVSESKRKSSTNSTGTSSTSTTSSSDSTTSSSSDSEEEPAEPQPRSESLFSTSPRETTKRSTAKDWPFLDKGPRPAASSGSSSSSESSAPSSPGKSSPPPPPPAPPPPQRIPDSPSRTEPPKPLGGKNADKKRHAPIAKRDDQTHRQPRGGRGRGTSSRGRSRASDSRDRIGDADVRSGDLPDGQRISVEGGRAKSRKARLRSTADGLDDDAEKEVAKPGKLLSPVGKADKKLREQRAEQPARPEKKVTERREAAKTESALDRLFGTPEKSERVEKFERDLSWREKPSVVQERRRHKSPEKVLKSSERKSLEKRSKSPEKPIKPVEKPPKLPEKAKLPPKSFQKPPKSPERPPKPVENTPKLMERLPDLTERITKPNEKSTRGEQLLRHPNEDLREQINKKSDAKEIVAEKKTANRKPSSKSKSIEDILCSSSESKENESDASKQQQPPPTSTLKLSKASDEITIADKIVDDHLQTHKANELYDRRRSEAVREVYDDVTAPSDVVANSILDELECEKRNALKPTSATNRVLQCRSIFSPQPHAKEAADLLDFNFDDIAITKDDEIVKGGPLTWTFNNSSSTAAAIREDTKEESARETLNLVEKLRLGLSKKSTGCDVDDAATSNERVDFSEQVVPDNSAEATTEKAVDNKPDEVVNISLEVKVQVAQAQAQAQVESAKHFEEASKPGYGYGYDCEPNTALETNENIPIQQHQGLCDHGAPAEGDERWVPPSENCYLDIRPPDPVNYLNDSLPNADAHYLEQYADAGTPQDHHHQNARPCSNPLLPAQLDVRLQEESLKSRSPSLQERIDRRISQTPLIDTASMDCMPSPMPYANIHPQAKWADNEIMPNRRSSSSSAASSTSSGSRRDNDDEARMQDVRLVNHSSLDVTPYGFPPNSLDNFGAYSDASCYPVSLFPPPNLNTQLAFPPAGPAAMFPPPFGAPFPTPHSLPPMPKPLDDSMSFSSTCTAAFTSSQHNMALTAAMVNLPPSTTPKPIAVEELPATCAQASMMAVEEVVASPMTTTTTTVANISNALPSPSTSLKSNSSAGKKSPSKPTRTSARVTSQMMNKSPAKSPGKSPRQEAALKQSGPGRGRGDGSKRGSGKSGASRQQTSARGGRGRGRGRGRGGHHNDYDYIGSGTIHTKLVGTVYDLDFDDDISNDNMTDLKSMRERRRSVDVHEKRFESFASTRDSPRSPKFSSPSQAAHKCRSYNADLRDLRPPTPIVEDGRSKTDASTTGSDDDPPRMFPDVTPVLPGPVDMRTYNSNLDQQTYTEQNLLSAFASGTAETQVHDDIDEDFEKELHTALTAKKPVLEPPPPPLAESTSNNIKVSLSDSRNQLKVKIKGPIANYTSTVAPLPPPAVDPGIVVSTINSVTNNAISGASIGISSGGTSSLRRMRKKELLRQYWTQDMNMDDPTGNPGYVAPAAPALNRTIITIPKAVASMTSIPTKEDYRDYRTGADDFVDGKHHRKESKARPGTLSRELRQLDLSLDDEERRRSLGNNSGLSTSFESKRRGRPPRPSQQLATPKLKIKIGATTNSIVGGVADDRRDRIRPPKKRLTTMNTTPTVEDLKRESMKFRKLVIKDLKTKKKKNKDKSEKRKKKRLKPEVQIISNQGANPTKLIIRFGKKCGDGKNGDGCDKRTTSGATTLNECRTECGAAKEVAAPSGAGGDKLPPPKLTPIKLKLSRCQEGSGYVMKPSTSTPSREEKAEEAQAVQPGQPPPEPPPTAVAERVRPPAAPLSKDCEVR